MQNPFGERSFGLFVFDLDGTLVDSLGDIAAALNAVRGAHGLPPAPLETVRAGIGAGARALIERTSGAELGPGADRDRLYLELLEQYRVHCVRNPRLYPGAREFLEATSREIPLAVLTNKPLEIALLTLEAARIEGRFTRVLAPENAGRKPDPAGLLTLMNDLAVERSETALFGDSGTDFATGGAAGIFTIGLRGGYYHAGEAEPDLWVDSWWTLRDWWETRR